MENEGVILKNYKFNITTLLIFNLLISILIFFSQKKEIIYFCSVVALLLMLFSGLYKKFISFVLFYVALYLFQYMILDFIKIKGIKATVGTFSYIWFNLLPIVILGVVMVNTIKTNELVNFLEKIKISRPFVIAIVVAFSYFPVIGQESKRIRESMKLRGINSSILHTAINPIKTFEYILVPILFRSIKISEELAMNAIIRGIENNGKRSSFYDDSISKIDCLFLIVFFISTAITLKLLYY